MTADITRLPAAADDLHPRPFDALLAEAAPAFAGYLAGKLRRVAGAGEPAVPCRSLFTPEGFEAAFAPFAARYPGADRRAVVSLWTLHYFSTLAIAPLVLWRRCGVVPPLGLGDTSAVIDPESHEPAAFVVGEARPPASGLSAAEVLAPLIDGHLRPAIAFLAGHGRLAPRLLWTNAAGYIDWILRELADDAGVVTGLALLSAPLGADGTANPLHGLILRGDDGVPRRKVCCLRYLVPGIGGCGESCPLPQGRA